MTTAQIEAYNEIVARGLLGKKQFIVYDYIRSHGPVTINTMLSNLAKTGDNTGAYTGRVSELQQMGVIAVNGAVMGPKGHYVSLYEVVPGALPVKVQRKPKADMKALLVEAHDLIENMLSVHGGSDRQKQLLARLGALR